MPPQPDILKLLESLVLLGVEGLCLAFFIVLTCLSFRELRHTWHWALLCGAIAAALGIPSTIVGIIYVDVNRFVPAPPHPGGQPENMMVLYRVLGGIVALMLLTLQVPLRAMYYHVAAVEWGRVRGSMAEGLAGPRGTRLLGLGVGVAVGAVLIVATYAVFFLCHVHEGQDIRDLQRLFPGIENLPEWLLLIVGMAFVSSAAIVEELVFRGGILGFLLRLTRNDTLLAWVFIAAVALLWALLHIPNTDTPVLKVTQIFIFGLALGAMTRQWGIGSAISAHLTLNLGAVIGALIFPQI